MFRFSFLLYTLGSLAYVQAFMHAPNAFRIDTSLCATQMNRRDMATTVASSTLAALTVIAPSANADDSQKLVEFTVENLADSSSGKIVIKLEPQWAPNGVERFSKLTEAGFWDGCRAFRVLPNFIVQFGINGNPEVQAKYRVPIPDDKVTQSNKRGTVTFATAGPNTRTTQIFINTGNNVFLDKQGFSPIGTVIEGMDVVDKMYSGYGEGAPRGRGPNQGYIQMKGNEYLESEFPKLSYFGKAKFI